MKLTKSLLALAAVAPFFFVANANANTSSAVSALTSGKIYSQSVGISGGFAPTGIFYNREFYKNKGWTFGAQATVGFYNFSYPSVALGITAVKDWKNYTDFKIDLINNAYIQPYFGSGGVAIWGGDQFGFRFNVKQTPFYFDLTGGIGFGLVVSKAGSYFGFGPGFGASLGYRF